MPYSTVVEVVSMVVAIVAAFIVGRYGSGVCCIVYPPYNVKPYTLN